MPIPDLPASWAAARIALRLTAAGTELDPGPRIVHADTLGGVAILAAAIVPGTPPAPDVHTLERAAAHAPWMLATLHAITSTATLRAAAQELTIHHSTPQNRVTHAENVLGWPIRDPQGRFRLELALLLRRLYRHPPDIIGPMRVRIA